MPLHKALGYKIVLHVLIAGIAMYFLLRTLGLRRRAALAGGVGYMVAPYLLSLIYAGHDAKMFVTALFPLCIMLLERLIRQPKLIGSALFGGSIGLLLLTSHPQMAYFASWGLGLYLVFNVPRMVRNGVVVKCIALIVLAVLLGIGIGSVQFLPTYYYTTNFSPRTGGVTLEFASSWSLHPEEIASLLYPSFAGYLGDYWGRNYFKLNAESPGPMILLLALAGFVLVVRRRDMLPWLVLFVFCPLYALGAHTPLFKAIFHLVPGAQFLRAPSVIMFMFSCSASVLAAFFIDSFLDKKISRSQRQLLIGLAVGILMLTIVLGVGRGAFLSLWKAVFGWPDAQKLGIAQATAAKWPADIAAIAVFTLGVVVTLMTALRRKWHGAVWMTILLVGLLVTGLRHSLKFVEYINVADFTRMDPIIELVNRDTDKFRVLPATGWGTYDRNYLPIFGIETANGFYDNRIRYYDYLIGENSENLFHPNVMAITNTKYVLSSRELDLYSLRLKQDFGRAFVYENQTFLGRAHIVHNARVAEDDSIALEAIKRASFDPSTTVMLHSGTPMDGGPPLPGEYAKIESYDLNEIEIHANLESPGYIFYSGNYLPYWNAYVDGREVPLERANISMRAIKLPQGEHRVKMKYESKWFNVGTYLSLACCAFIGLCVAAELRRRRRVTRSA
jgi:hypothetical protein